MANKSILIGIDTNVLARYILLDDPQQSEQASQFLESLTADKKGFISVIVLVELVWLLRRVYKQTRLQVAEILDELLAIDMLVFEQQVYVYEALAIYQNVSSDFSDLLINRLNAMYGCDYTVSFDNGAVDKAGMKVLVNLRN